MASANESYERILTANLQRANDFLRFAEAKNAALIALGSGWFIASLNLECSGKTIPSPFTLCVPVAMIFSLSAAMLSLVSFLPRLNLAHFRGGRRAGPHNKNLLYFGDIASIPIKTLEAELRSRYYPDGEDLRPEYLEDLAVQVSVNSEIAMRKMKLFRGGVTTMAIAVVATVIPALILTFRNLEAYW